MSKFLELDHLEQTARKVDEVKQDKLTGKPGQVAGFGKDGNLEAQDLPEVETATDHGKLEGRDAVDQHPISAITGLQEALNAVTKLAEGKQDQVEFATTEEVDEMLNSVFGSGATSPKPPAGPNDPDGCDCTPEFASDEEVDAMLSGIFGR